MLTHRPTMEDHVPRHAQMGAWVLINDRWYYGRTLVRQEQCTVLLVTAFRKSPRTASSASFPHINIELNSLYLAHFARNNSARFHE